MLNPTFDPRLGRLVEFDRRSLSYPVTDVLEAKKPRSYSWACRKTLDQGQEGSCVGHAWAHELGARPSVIENATHDVAVQIYKLAQKLDPWPGENYEGTSVLAGVKAIQQLWPPFIKEYRWAFSLNELILALGYTGPAVLGISWHTGMFTPDANGLIHVTGPVAGGHAILAKGVDVRKKLITLKNSWGPRWGKDGECQISFDDMEKLLSASGEACIPVGRLKGGKRL